MDGSVQATASSGVARRKGYWRKKKKGQGRSWNGYCQIPALGRDPGFRPRPGLVEVGREVATRK